MEKEKWTVIKTLRHARHDWMNDIQVVKGYLALHNFDEAARAADHIIMKAVQESRLCNLGMPGMAELFMTFNWSPHLFKLEYEVDQHITSGRADDQNAVRFFTCLFSLLEQHVEEYNEHQLFVHISEKEQRFSVQMEWMGEVADRPLLLDRIRDILKKLELKRTVLETDGQDILMEVTF